MGELKERSHYWQQVGSVILGGLIAAVASGLVTYQQARSQRKQFVLDKQIILLKEYSSSFNQQSFGVLFDLKAINGMFIVWEETKVKTIRAKDWQTLDDAIKKATSGIAVLGSNMVSQRTMVYALFGVKPTEIRLAQGEEELEKLRRAMFDELKKRKTESEKLKLLHTMFSETESMLTQGIDDENDAISSLALRIGEAYRN